MFVCVCVCVGGWVGGWVFCDLTLCVLHDAVPD